MQNKIRTIAIAVAITIVTASAGISAKIYPDNTDIAVGQGDVSGSVDSSAVDSRDKSDNVSVADSSRNVSSSQETDDTVNSSENNSYGNGSHSASDTNYSDDAVTESENKDFAGTDDKKTTEQSASEYFYSEQIVNQEVTQESKTQYSSAETTNKNVICYNYNSQSATASRETTASKQSTTASKETTTSKQQTTASGGSNTDSGSTVSGSEKTEVYNLVNQYRSENGLSELSYRRDLESVADLRAKEIVTNFSHTRPNGTSCFTAVTEAGITYTAVGENIAYGQKSASEVMTGWMNSSGHRANILSSKYTGIAVGLYQKNGVKYWVQLFIK